MGDLPSFYRELRDHHPVYYADYDTFSGFEDVPLGRFDRVTDFAGVIAASSICQLFGLPVDRAQGLFDDIHTATRPVENGGRLRRLVQKGEELHPPRHPHPARRR